MDLILTKLVILKSTIGLQIQKLLMFSLMISPITWILERLNEWHIGNSDYVAFVIGAIAIDHILGSMYHAFWLRDFSMKKNIYGLITKLVIVLCVGYLFEGLDALMVESSILKDYTVMVLRLMVFLYPASSAFQNSYEMTGKKFPPMAFMEKLKKFSESATFNSSDKK